MQTTLLADVLAQQLMGSRIENSHVECIPLHFYQFANPARWQTVKCGFDFDAAIEMHDAVAVLVIAEGFQWQCKQRRLFLGEHCRDLPFCGAVDAGIGPSQFPVIEVDRKSTRLNSSHVSISYAVFCLKK